MWLTDLITDFLKRFDLVDRPFEDIAAFTATAKDVPKHEQESSDLHRLFYENKGPIVHKWRHYLTIYEKHLAAFRQRRAGQPPVRLLEIGVSKGGSLRLWRKYFGVNAVIFGIDINQNCSALDGQSGNVRIGSQSDTVFLKSIVSEMGGVDIVIDDGSHNASDQTISFETLFPLMCPRGIYICEDLHTSYWSGHGYEGGYRRSTSFIEFMKKAVDDIHADFHTHPQTVLNAHRTIAGIFFYNSMVVVEKAPQERPVHIIVGEY